MSMTLPDAYGSVDDNTSGLRKTNSSMLCVSPENFHGSWLFAVTVVGTVFTAVSAVGNGIIIVAFLRTKSLRKPSTILLTNLALGDLLYGIVGFPIYLVPNFHSQLFCNALFNPLRNYILSILILMALNNIAVIALERFIGIQFPYHYRSTLTTNRIYSMAALSWIIGIIRAVFLAGILFDTKKISLKIELSVNFILLALTICVYCRVYQISKYHLNRDKSYGIRHQESKSQTAVMVAAVNALSWAPVIFARVIDTFIVDITFVTQVTFLVPFIGTCLNLFVYTYRMRDYRRAVKRLFLTCSCVMRRADTTSTLQLEYHKS